MLNLDRKRTVILSTEQMEIIKSFGILKVEHWKRNETKLRKKFAKDLCRLQNGLCVYCGCLIYGAGDVEHIANKAIYTEFMFTPLNLAYACKTCNQIYKGSINVIKKRNTEYDKCEFKIVHPYLDNVDDFFDTSVPVIKIRDSLSDINREKAEFTYELFKWNSEEVSIHRAQWLLTQYTAKKRGKTISQIASEFEDILTYIP